MENKIRLTLIIITALLMGITIAGFAFTLHPEIIKETKIIVETNSYNVVSNEVLAPSINYHTIEYEKPYIPPKPIKKTEARWIQTTYY